MSAGSAATEARSAVAPRPATPDDVDEVVRLAGVMYRSLGAAPQALPADRWDRWLGEAADAVRRRLGRDLAVFVCDRREGGLAACGAGTVSARLPHPWHPEARVGYVQWMSTDPDRRRQGHGRAILRALVAWFAAQGIDTVELHATAAGAPLYRSEGFWGGSTGTAMRRRSWDPPPPGAP